MRALLTHWGLTHGREFTESVRTMHVYSIHGCCEIMNAVTKLTKMYHTISEQYHEMGKSRTKTDYEDLMKVLSWFNTHSPFDQERTELQSLSRGMIFDANCDDVEFIGSKIQKKLDGYKISKAKSLLVISKN